MPVLWNFESCSTLERSHLIDIAIACCIVYCNSLLVLYTGASGYQIQEPSKGLCCCETSWKEAASMGHEGSARGHGSCVVSTSGAELEPSAADPVEQRQNSAAGVDELPVERHGSTAWGDDNSGSRWDSYTATPAAVWRLTFAVSNDFEFSEY